MLIASANAENGSTKSSGHRVGMKGKFWMLDQNGVPNSSRGYHAGKEGREPKMASCANCSRRICKVK